MSVIEPPKAAPLLITSAACILVFGMPRAQDISVPVGANAAATFVYDTFDPAQKRTAGVQKKWLRKNSKPFSKE
jgi:hypothetical protein